MKKFLLPVAVVAAFAFSSCGGVDIDKMADEYCACMKETDPEKSATCIKEWTDKYKDSKGTEEDGKKLAEKIAKCE